MSSTINERIVEIRKTLNVTQAEFGREIGVGRGVIANIENNLTEAKPLLIDQICKVYNVNKDWILTGDGETFNVRTKNEEIAEFVGRVLAGDDDFKTQLIALLAALSEDEWELLHKMALRLTAEQKAREARGNGDE